MNLKYMSERDREKRSTECFRDRSWQRMFLQCLYCDASRPDGLNALDDEVRRTEARGFVSSLSSFYTNFTFPTFKAWSVLMVAEFYQYFIKWCIIWHYNENSTQKFIFRLALLTNFLGKFWQFKKFNNYLHLKCQ